MTSDFENISLLIYTHDSVSGLRQLLLQLETLSDNFFEVLMFDDNSKDITWNVSSKFTKLKNFKRFRSLKAINDLNGLETALSTMSGQANKELLMLVNANSSCDLKIQSEKLLNSINATDATCVAILKKSPRLFEKIDLNDCAVVIIRRYALLQLLKEHEKLQDLKQLFKKRGEDFVLIK